MNGPPHLDGARWPGWCRRAGPYRLCRTRCAAAGLLADAHPVSGPAWRRAVEDADLIACCTTARTPPFSGDLVDDGAVVVAVGSHEPGARELDDDLVARSTVVAEARTAALAEAGDLVIPLRAGRITADHLAGDLADLTTGRVAFGPGPRVFKSVGMAWQDSVGMAWQDLVVAVTAYRAWRGVAGEREGG